MAEIRETFQVPKVGTVAGVRVQRAPSRAHTKSGCSATASSSGQGSSPRRQGRRPRGREGLRVRYNLEGFNDIKVGDMLETFVQEEVSRSKRCCSKHPMSLLGGRPAPESSVRVPDPSRTSAA